MDQQDRDFNAGGSSPVDLSVLEQYRELQDEGDPDIVAELIDTFLSDIPNRVSGIREALDSGNPTQLEHEAHNLKGSSANLGAHTLASISLELERLGRENSLDGVRELVDLLEQEIERVRLFLDGESEAT